MFLHDLKIAHLDIKTENVMVDKVNNNAIRLIDFAFSCIGNACAEPGLNGTLEYMMYDLKEYQKLTTKGKKIKFRFAMDVWAMVVTIMIMYCAFGLTG